LTKRASERERETDERRKRRERDKRERERERERGFVGGRVCIAKFNPVAKLSRVRKLLCVSPYKPPSRSRRAHR